jgi:hypothetical protein
MEPLYAKSLGKARRKTSKLGHKAKKNKQAILRQLTSLILQHRN